MECSFRILFQFRKRISINTPIRSLRIILPIAGIKMEIIQFMYEDILAKLKMMPKKDDVVEEENIF